MAPLTILPLVLLLTTALAHNPHAHPKRAADFPSQGPTIETTPVPSRFPGPIIDSTPVPSRFPGPTFFTSYYGTNYWPYLSSHTSKASTATSAGHSAVTHSSKTAMTSSTKATAATKSAGTTSAAVSAASSSTLPAATNGAGGLQGAGRMVDMAIVMGVGVVGGLIL